MPGGSYSSRRPHYPSNDPLPREKKKTAGRIRCDCCPFGKHFDPYAIPPNRAVRLPFWWPNGLEYGAPLLLKDGWVYAFTQAWLFPKADYYMVVPWYERGDIFADHVPVPCESVVRLLSVEEAERHMASDAAGRAIE